MIDIVYTEKFNEGMQHVLDAVKTSAHASTWTRSPGSTNPKVTDRSALHPVEDYFDDLSMHLVYEIYKRDFQRVQVRLRKSRQQAARSARSIWTRCTPSWAIDPAGSRARRLNVTGPGLPSPPA